MAEIIIAVYGITERVQKNALKLYNKAQKPILTEI